MRQKLVVRIAISLSLILIALLAAGCGTETPAPAATPTIAATVAPAAAPTIAPEAPAAVDPAQSPAAGAGPEAGATSAPIDAGDGLSVGEVADAVSSRTPEPTPTPDVVAEKVEELTAEAGLSGKTFLGLAAEDWIDLAVSLLIVLLGYLVAVVIVKLLLALLRHIVSKTPSGFDDAFLEAIASELKWLVVVLISRFALLRLDFWSDDLRTLIDDLYFALGTGIIAAIVLKLISAAAQWYRDNLEPETDRDRLEPILLVLQRVAYALVIIIWISIILSHLGINITAFSAVLVVVALVISLGAKDVISDAISGFIILIDQPFRVGDVIEIEELDKWGDVVDIGTRVTRIRTRDHRYAIVPNSKIGSSQVINYTFPDPKYRVHSNILVAYGSDFDEVQRVAQAAVRSVEGVLPDQPVNVLFLNYVASARGMQVQWWIDQMHQEQQIIDGVHRALETAFEKAGIEMPVTTRDLIVQLDTGMGDHLSLSPAQPDASEKRSAADSTPDGENRE